MSSLLKMNRIVNIDNEPTPKYSSHWHLRLTDIKSDALVTFLEDLSKLVSCGYLSYCCVGEKEVDARPHIHAALGTARSMKQVTLARKLGLVDKVKMKTLCQNYYLSGVYKDSTVGRNVDYIKNGHKVVLELGTPKDLDVKIRDLPLVFER